VKVLGIESSGDTGGVALVDAGRPLGEIVVDLRGAHTQRLLPAVRDLLRGVGRTISEVEGVAVSLGPGSFTGLRAGLGLGKGLAYAVRVRLVGIPTLEVLACDAGPGEWVLAVADARRGEIFSSLYRRVDRRLEACWPAELGRVEDLAARLTDRMAVGSPGVAVVSDGAGPLEAIGQALARAGIRVGTAIRAAPRPVVVARLGARRLAGDVGDDPMTLEPLYVRRSDAEEGRRG